MMVWSSELIFRWLGPRPGSIWQRILPLGIRCSRRSQFRSMTLVIVDVSVPREHSTKGSLRFSKEMRNGGSVNSQRDAWTAY